MGAVKERLCGSFSIETLQQAVYLLRVDRAEPRYLYWDPLCNLCSASALVPESLGWHSS